MNDCPLLPPHLGVPKVDVLASKTRIARTANLLEPDPEFKLLIVKLVACVPEGYPAKQAKGVTAIFYS